MKYISIRTFSLMFLSSILLLSCTTKKVTESEKVSIPEYAEPDNFFDQASVNFTNGDRDASIAEIEKAMTFVASVIVNTDSIKNQRIDEAKALLMTLSNDIKTGKITSVNQMKLVFVAVDRLLTKYHMAVIEEWIANEKTDKESLERIHRSVVRTEYALYHFGIALTVEEVDELQKAKRDLHTAEIASESLWIKIKSIILSLDSRIDGAEQ